MAQCQPTPAPAEGRAPDAPQARPGSTSQTETGPRSGSGSGSGWVRFLPLAVAVVAVAVLAASGFWRHVSLTELRDRRAELQAFTHRHPVLSLEVYAGAFAVVVAFSIPGALVMTLGGGYLFGALAGGVAAVAGETAGAVAMFLAARSAFGAAFADKVFRRGGLWRRIVGAIEDNPFTGLLMLRLIPAMPFNLVNVAAGLVRMPTPTYVAATLIGITPSTFVYAWIGQGLGVALNRNGAPRISTLVRPEVFLPLMALGALGVGVFLLKVRRGRGPRPPPQGGTPCGPSP